MNNSVLTASLVLVAMPLFAQTDDKRTGEGQDVFEEYCIGCHGSDGRAETDMSKKVGAADLTSDAVQQQSDSHLRTVIKEGKGKMPSFSQKLSDNEISSVLAYVRQMVKR
jgi:cbb3-type cytochrome c oxidase subunit III